MGSRTVAAQAATVDYNATTHVIERAMALFRIDFVARAPCGIQLAFFRSIRGRGERIFYPSRRAFALRPFVSSRMTGVRRMEMMQNMRAIDAVRESTRGARRAIA